MYKHKKVMFVWGHLNNTMNTIIFGFVGPMVSGKGTAAAYLKEKHGAVVFRFSTILRDLLDRISVVQSRDNLMTMSEVMRGNFGEDILAKAIARDAAHASTPLVVIDGIRRPTDIGHLMQLPEFILIEITADIHVRHKRLILRKENTDDATKTFEQFTADHDRDAERLVPEVAKQAREHIDNNGSIEDLYRQLDDLVTKYGG